MRLFISHASEDKGDFVRPLAEALRLAHDVWYDEYELTLGDSLLRKINEGLVSCDYGIVVLSQAFFRKKWPQAELDGLFALEGSSRKLILPIWKDVSVAEVRQFSPILAGRLSIPSSEGVPAVVAAINRAIEVSERTRQISPSAISRAKALDQNLKQKRDAGALLSSIKGTNLVAEEWRTFCKKLETQLSQLSQESDVLKFRFGRPMVPQLLYVHGIHDVSLLLNLKEMCSNSAAHAVMMWRFFLNRGDFNDRPEPEDIAEFSFKPTFDSAGHVAWVDRCIWLCAFFQKESDDLDMTFLGSSEQRGEIAVGFGIYAHARRNEQLHGGNVAIGGAHHKIGRCILFSERSQILPGFLGVVATAGEQSGSCDQ